MPRQKFESGYLADTNTLDNDQRIDDSKRSFMDKGDSVFENDGGRDQIAAGVRLTLLKKMRDVNNQSKQIAEAMEQEHTRFENQQMLPLIALAKKKVRDSNIAYAEYLLAKSKESSASANSVQQEMQYLLTNGSLLTRREDAIANQQNPIIQNDQDEDDNSEDAVSESVELNESNISQNSNESNDIENNGANNGENAENQPNPVNVAAQPQENQDNVQERNRDLAKLRSLSNEINANTRKNRWALTKLVMSVEKKKSKAERKKDQAIADAQSMGRQIRQAANRWNAIRDNHRRGTFRQLYRSYDVMAMRYYAFSRTVGQNQRKIELIENNQEGAAKRIAEYTGVFDTDQLETLITDAISRPYSQPPVLRHKRYKETGANSANENDPNKFIKYHKTIATAGFADGINNRIDEKESGRTGNRYKLLSDFTGYEAKSQYTNVNYDRIAATARNADERGKTEALAGQGQNASQMNLMIDEKGTNGEYLLSEKNAKIYEAKTKGIFNKRSVHGFYVGNQFISDNYSTIKSNKEVGKLVGSSIKDAEQEEKLRLAIRRSDFFRHVNAATIQYYSSYNADQVKDINEIKQKITEEAQALNQQNGQNNAQNGQNGQGNANQPGQNNQGANQPGQNNQGAGQQGQVQNNPVNQQIVQVAWEDQPASYKLIQLIDAYVNPNTNQANLIHAGTDDQTKNRIEEIFTQLLAEDEKRESCREIVMIMLAEEDTALWEMARRFSIIMGGRFQKKAERLPANGEFMRMGLLEEVANDRAFNLEDIGNSILPTSLQMHKEDLAAKRDGFFSLTNVRQSFWDGSLFSPFTGAMGAISGDLKTYEYQGDLNLVFNRFNKNYADVTAKASTSYGLLLPAIPAIVGEMSGGTIQGLNDKGEAVINDKADKALSAVGSIYTGISFIQDVYKLVKKVQKLMEKDSDKKALLLDILKMLVDIVVDVFTMIQWWLDKPFVKDALSLLGAIKNALDIVKDIMTIYRSNKEINKIKKSDADINTAMTDFAAKKGELQQQNQDVTEANMTTVNQKMGLANSKNAQGQYFLALAKSRARRDRNIATFDIASSAISGAGNLVKYFAWPVSFAFKSAAKVVSFIGWCADKIHDRIRFNDNIEKMLGAGDYAKTPHFSEALKRETGIQNKHYLVDLARIFMAIDTHHLVTKGDKTDGETALAMNLMNPYIKLAGEGDARFSDDENKRKLQEIKFEKLLAAVGGPNNWRAVLRSSITG